MNAVVFGVEGISERALKSLWSEERPMLTGPLGPLGPPWSEIWFGVHGVKIIEYGDLAARK